PPPCSSSTAGCGRSWTATCPCFSSARPAWARSSSPACSTSPRGARARRSSPWTAPPSPPTCSSPRWSAPRGPSPPPAPGGVAERRGNFQLAEGGTLFLDEIGEMPLALQAKLLRALQGKEIRPVGGTAQAIDVRVVAATNSDIERRTDDGRFRRDLYYRIAGF